MTTNNLFVVFYTNKCWEVYCSVCLLSWWIGNSLLFAQFFSHFSGARRLPPWTHLPRATPPDRRPPPQPYYVTALLLDVPVLPAPPTCTAIGMIGAAIILCCFLCFSFSVQQIILSIFYIDKCTFDVFRQFSLSGMQPVTSFFWSWFLFIACKNTVWSANAESSYYFIFVPFFWWKHQQTRSSSSRDCLSTIFHVRSPARSWTSS